MTELTKLFDILTRLYYWRHISSSLASLYGEITEDLARHIWTVCQWPVPIEGYDFCITLVFQ